MGGLNELCKLCPPALPYRLYVHSAVANWKKCLHSIKLKDSVLSLVYVAPTKGWGQGPKGPAASAYLTDLPFQACQRPSAGSSCRWDLGYLPSWRG